MGEGVITLADVASQLCEFDQTYTIYAAEPWTESSSAVVDYEPDEGGFPAEASRLGLSYFLEIEIANDVIAGWINAGKRQPSDSEICQRLIEYAVNDA